MQFLRCHLEGGSSARVEGPCVSFTLCYAARRALDAVVRRFRRLAALRACRDNALCEAVLRGSRFNAASRAWERFRLVLLLRARPFS
jgi:hypothetical protein